MIITDKEVESYKLRMKLLSDSFHGILDREEIDSTALVQAAIVVGQFKELSLNKGIFNGERQKYLEASEQLEQDLQSQAKALVLLRT